MSKTASEWAGRLYGDHAIGVQRPNAADSRGVNGPDRKTGRPAVGRVVRGRFAGRHDGRVHPAAIDAFWSVLQRLSGASIVTTSHGDRLAGCYVGFLGGCSNDPPRMLVCMGSTGGYTAELIRASKVLAVHLICEGQEEWFDRYALQSSRTVDKFEGLGWDRGETGSPILRDAIGYVEGRVIGSLDCGDHDAHLVDPVNAELRKPDVRPLTGLELLARDPWHEGPLPPQFR